MMDRNTSNSTAIRLVEAATPAEMRWLEVPRDKLIATLQSSLYHGAKPESIAMVLDYCQTAGLNVMLKPVHIVPMSVKTGQNRWEMRDIIMPGINHYRTQASRSGCYVGKSEPEFGPDVTRRFGNVEITFPEWCRITVKRKIGDYIAEFSATEFWEENFATAGRDKPWPNAMWQKRPRGQLAKCCEAQALRMAFPEFAADATAEEMEGKVIDLTVEAVDKPRAAIASLDQFAGSSADPAQDAQEQRDAEPEGVETTDADIEPVEAPDGQEQAKGPPTIPPEALKAFVESGDWQPGWEWWGAVIPDLAPEDRQALAERHAELLWAVYESDVREQGPQSQAAIRHSEKYGYHVPPVDKRARRAATKGKRNG